MPHWSLLEPIRGGGGGHTSSAAVDLAELSLVMGSPVRESEHHGLPLEQQQHKHEHGDEHDHGDEGRELTEEELSLWRRESYLSEQIQDHHQQPTPPTPPPRRHRGSQPGWPGFAPRGGRPLAQASNPALVSEATDTAVDADLAAPPPPPFWVPSATAGRRGMVVRKQSQSSVCTIS